MSTYRHKDRYEPSSSQAITSLYAGKLMPGAQTRTLASTHEAFPVRPVRRKGRVSPLPMTGAGLWDLKVTANGREYDLYEYVFHNRVAGLLIAHRGRVLHEQYELGLRPDTRWVSMSVAKSFATTLVGAAIQDGAIGGVDDLLTDYLPQLSGGGYDGVTIRQVLQMTSGVAWDDTHTDPSSQRRLMLQLQLDGRADSILSYMASLPRVAEPGTRWNYSTGETHVVGALVRAATGKWLADYLSEKIWSRIGVEQEACWWLDSPGGLEVAGSGLCATLRDYARFGRFVLGGGIVDDERIVPEGWFQEAGAARMIGGERLDYGYMWWAVPNFEGSLEDGAFSARGIFGQYMYLNPRQDLMIVVLSSRVKPRLSELILDNDFFNSVLRTLGD